MKPKRIQTSPNGPILSRIIAGVWKWGAWGWELNTQQHLDLIYACLDHEVTTFDHADIYGDYTSEGDFGKALALAPHLRQRIEIVSKCGIKLKSPNRPQHRIKHYDTSREHLIASVENSLRELHTDYIDVLLIHRPSPLMDADEVAEAFMQLRDSGKVLHFGVSNFSPSQFKLLHDRFELVTNQIEIHLMRHKPFFDGTLDLSQRLRVSPMAWSPLVSGRIFTDIENHTVRRIVSAAEELMTKYDAELDQIMLAFLLMHPSNILPILGTARPERVQAAVAALDIELELQDWFALWEASLGSEVP